MRTIDELNSHIARCQNCGDKFIITFQTIPTDLFKTQTTEVLTPLPLFCKSYFCESCSKVKRAKFVSKVKSGLGSDSWRFLTLTLRHHGADYDYQFRQISKDWNKLATLLRRKFKGLKYAKVLEIGNSDNVHLHILINKYVDKKFLQKYWQKYNNSFRIDISLVESKKNILFYISKYMSKTYKSKDINSIFYIFNKRRYSTSRNFSLKEKKESLFRLADSNLYDEYHLLDIIFKIFKLNKNNFYLFDFGYLSQDIIQSYLSSPP